MLPHPMYQLSLLMAALLAQAPALAAQWDVVTRDRARVVELDRGSVLPSDPGTKVAWARIVLGDTEVDGAGYASVKALNRYDCNARSFYTTKRVYLDREHNVIREERVAEPRPIQVDAGSVDEQLWREVCKPPGPRDLKKLAEEAGKAAAKAAAPVPATVPAPAPPAAARTADPAEARPMRRADFHPANKGEGAALTPSNDGAPALPAEPAPAPAREIAKPIPPLQLPLPPRPAPSVPAAAPEPLHAVAVAPPPASPKPAPKPRRAAPPPSSGEVRLAARTPEPAPDAVHHHRALHWSYEGESGPDNWGRMNPDWRACVQGQRQSPIDIRDGIRVELEPLKVDYRLSRVRVVDNGHTVQVTPDDRNTLMVAGRRFELVQFHFHRPSEERLDGRAFDMVVHLVHRDQDGRLGVVAVLLEVGSAHPLVQTLWNNLPLEKQVTVSLPEPLDLAQLWPATGDYVTYMGSLTTPPCSEDVLWMVMRQPVQISDDQLRVFSRLYPRNIRPIQRLNDRLIKESR